MKSIVIDKEFEIPIYSQVCSYCKNLLDGQERTCNAFPVKIPLDIWTGKNQHIKKHPHQKNDIVFERI